MNNKKLFFLIICSLIVLLLSSLAYTYRLVELSPGVMAPQETGTNHTILYSASNDSIYYYDIPGNPTANFTADAGDKMAVLFHQTRECSLYAIRFTNGGNTGPVKLGVYKSPITLDSLRKYYDPIVSGTGTPLPFDGLGPPLLKDPLWGPFDITLQGGTSDTSYILNTIDLATHGTGYVDIGRQDFIVSYELKFYDSVTVKATYLDSSDYDLAASIKYYAGSGSPGWRYRNYNWWFKCLVYYYGDSLVNVEEESRISPFVFSKLILEQNYPNPFNFVTNIPYQLSQNGEVNLTIYNMLGEKVKNLVNEKQGSGCYTIRWNSRDSMERDLPSGIYFYRLQVGNEKEIRKMLLIR